MASNTEGQRDKGVFHVRIAFLLLLLQQVNSGSSFFGGATKSWGHWGLDGESVLRAGNFSTYQYTMISRH